MLYKILLSTALTLTSFSLLGLCRFQEAPVVLDSDSKQTILLFKGKISPSFWSTEAVQEPVFVTFQNWVRNNTKVDQVFLLKRQRALFAQHPEFGNVAIFDGILSGEIGRIGPASCVEKLLHAKHLQHAGPKSFSEYGAWVLENKVEQTFKVYFLSNTEASVSFSTSVREAIEADLDSGFEFETFIHSHPFVFGNEDIGGTDIGSDPDFQTFYKTVQELNLKSARITNGFDSIVYSVGDIEKVHARHLK